MLHLIGVVHRDPRGANKLFNLFSRLKPAVVTVEMSSYSLAFRQKNGGRLMAQLTAFLRDIASTDKHKDYKSLLSHPEIEGITHLISIPFELIAARKYAQLNSATLMLIDDARWAKERLELWEQELLPRENLRTLLALPFKPTWSERIVAAYQSALTALLIDATRRPKNSGVTEVRLREESLAQKIRSLEEKFPAMTIAHIGGWEHLLTAPDNSTLADLLGDLKPQKWLLTDPPRCFSDWEGEGA